MAARKSSMSADRSPSSSREAPQQALSAPGVLWRQRDADTCPHMQTDGLHVDGLFEQRRDPPGHRRGLVGVRPVEEACELVTAQARHEVLMTDNLVDAWTDLAQQGVAGLVSEGIVDLLKVIEIDQQKGQFASIGIFVGRGV